jgi:sugar phosphate isomerase/epimerase
VVAQRLTPPERPGPRACLQLFTVRHALARDREGTFRRLYELGFRAVETAGFRGELPSAASRAELDGHGLDVVSSYFVGPNDRFAEHLDEQQAFGNDTVIVGLDAAYYTDEASVLEAVEVLNGFADQCASRGMRLGYHNHPWEVSVLDNGQVALAVLADGLRDHVFFEFDYYWAQVGGLGIGAARGIVEPRLERLHLKDGPLTDSQQASVFGEGAFDLAAAVHAAPRARWHIIAFDEFEGDALEASGTDLGYLLDRGLSVADMSATC